MLSCHHGPRGRVPTARRAATSLAVLLSVLGPVLGSGPARAAANTDRLLPGEVLLAGESISAGRDTLAIQADGDAILDAPGHVTLWSTHTSKQTYAAIQLPAHGWGPDQFGCLNSIWVRESGWNELAGHPASAYGIPQADPGSKMAAEGSDWLANPQTQIRRGEDYIQSRYGTPCQAWAYWQARRYDGPLLAVVLGAD
jgi:hypothetical protein